MKPEFSGAAAGAASLARTGLFLALCAAACLVTNCARQNEAFPRIVPAEGVTLPVVVSLAWLGAEVPDGRAGTETAAESGAGVNTAGGYFRGKNFSGGERFASLSDDGLVRVWELASGRLLTAFPAETEKPLSLAFNGEKAEPVFWSAAENGTVLPVLSPDGTKKIFVAAEGAASDDAAFNGAVCLAAAAGKDGAPEKVLAKYYGLTSAEGTSAGWLSVVPEGFYNASFNAASFFTAEAGERTYRLDQLSGALYRPDLFKARVLSGFGSAPREAALPANPEFLFGKDQSPPELSIVFDEGVDAGVKIKITAQKGGAGLLALYRHPLSAGKNDDEEIPAGLIDIEKAAEKKYSEKGKTCYELTLNLEPGEVGVSAFNTSGTIESGRVWITIPETQKPSAETYPVGNEASPPSPSPSGAIGLPALKVLIAAGDDGFRGHTASLAEAFSLQAEGSLYSAVEIKTLSGNDFTRAGFIESTAALFAGENRRDVHALYIRGRARADSLGNLRVKTFDGELSGDDMLAPILSRAANPLLIMDLFSDTNDGTPSHGALETALLRFRQRLGPKAMLGISGGRDAQYSAAQTIFEKLNPDFRNAGAPAFTGNRFLHAEELLDYAAGVIAEQGRLVMLFSPREDFDIADIFVNAGELKFQTMASGMLKIDRVDTEPVPLVFGETMIRALPPGSYIIDMVYRNGYRETRTVELRKKDSRWVTFNYTPPLLVGDFSLALRSTGGINVSELNPANYEKINREAMEGMGMAPYYVAFLSGEKLYKEGNYDGAIREYSRALSLKADYADAYASRGNARRRQGDFNRALEDYTRALNHKSGYAEVYNYRGFVYAQRGDMSRAIADYTQAIRHRADYADAYFNRAHAYGRQGEWDKAIADYTQVIKLEPANAAAYRERARAWSGKGEADKAAADYETAGRLEKR